jgi:hypothetical protein
MSGSVVGPRLNASLCLGGATEYVEVTPNTFAVASQTLLLVNLATTGDPATHFAFKAPTNAVEGDLNGLLGMTGPKPGTFSSATGCGSLALCVTLPIPPDVVCTGSGPCAAGCALEGPVLGPTCQAIQPELCYEASASNDCVSGTDTPRGSFSFTLTSVDEYAPDASSSTPRYTAHGTLDAELWNSDGTDDSAELAVTF